MIDMVGLLRHEAIHVLITAMMAGWLFRRSRDWRLILVAFTMGMLVDLDHWLDYFSYFGLRINLVDFFNVSSYVGPSGKTYLFFHGWEFVLLFWLIGRWWGKKIKARDYQWALSLPYFGHLLLDNFSFPHHLLAYSFFYRLLNGFSLESFL